MRYMVCEVGGEKRQFVAEVEDGENIRVCLMEAFRENIGHDGSLYAPHSAGDPQYVGAVLRLQFDDSTGRDSHWILGAI